MNDSTQRYLETPFSISLTGFQHTQNLFHSDLLGADSKMHEEIVKDAKTGEIIERICFVNGDQVTYELSDK